MIKNVVMFVDKFAPGYKTHMGFIVMIGMALCQFITGHGWIGSAPVTFAQEDWMMAGTMTVWFWKMNVDKKIKK